ncbi:uncharacterized protein LOC135474508 [Liolophura sinensis]|uniref:uncharacterized protein LOC135474508 n=1 Tax=Liolophura sinensis TaxID=3198878 RepID=UPI00315831A9
MADVSLDDYILQTGLTQRANKGYNGPVKGKVVISNPGVKGRLGGLTTKNKRVSPIKWQNTNNRATGFAQHKQDKQGQQFGLTTKKFAGGLVTRKFSGANQNPQANVTVTGVGSYQKFDARQKLSTKKPVDARAKILEKTKFSDARVRIQNARATKETKGPGPRVQLRSPPSAGTQVRAQAGGNGAIVRTVNNNPNTGAVRFGGITRTNGGGLQFNSGGSQLHSGGNQLHSGGVQIHRGGELKITKPSNFEKPSMPSFSKTISSMKVPSGYEDLFEDEPMSLGSECSSLIDADRGPVIKVKNEHYSQYSKPTPITFNTDARPQRSGNGTSRMAPVTIARSEPVTVSRSAPIMYSSQITDKQSDPPNVRLSMDYADEEEFILNAPTPVLPKSRPPPPKPATPVMVGGPPLVLSRSRPKTVQSETAVSSAPVAAPLKLSRPSGRLSAPSSSSRVLPKEKITLSASSSIDGLKRDLTEDVGPGDVLSPLQGFRILVTNLHPIVTQDDVIELFGAIGALKKARLVKQGSAEVVYVNKEAAVVAVKKYHNRELDGQPMQVKLITPVTASVPTPKISAEIKALTKSVKDSVGKPSGPPVDTGLIHKALFKTGGTVTGTKPVTFTVKI